jgi:hypothetical protein
VQDSEKQIVAYEATHQLQFNIADWTGFETWESPPRKALAPYAAITQCIAIRRAHETLAAMGISNLMLPKPPADEYDQGIAEAIQKEPQVSTTH